MCRGPCQHRIVSLRFPWTVQQCWATHTLSSQVLPAVFPDRGRCTLLYSVAVVHPISVEFRPYLSYLRAIGHLAGLLPLPSDHAFLPLPVVPPFFALKSVGWRALGFERFALQQRGKQRQPKSLTH
eukprot:1185097-Prorocentrum_minimum.AAC.3